MAERMLVIGSEGKENLIENTYMIRILTEGQEETDQLTEFDKGFILNVDYENDKIMKGPIAGVLAQAKFSSSWIKCTIPDVQLDKWLEKAQLYRH